MTPRHVRALRGTAAAWIATIVAATAHTLAGGGAPAPVTVAVLSILASPPAVVLVGRRLSFRGIATAVVASQGLFHVAFALTAGADPALASGHVHGAALPGSSGAVSGFLPDAPMVLAHVLAAAATMLALYSGERMLRALGRGIRSVLRRAGEIAPLSPVRSRIAAAVPAAAGLGVILSDVSRRGPPSAVIAAH